MMNYLHIVLPLVILDNNVVYHSENTDDKTGLVVGLIIAAIVVLLIAGFVIYKVRKGMKSRASK